MLQPPVTLAAATAISFILPMPISAYPPTRRQYYDLLLRRVMLPPAPPGTPIYLNS